MADCKACSEGVFCSRHTTVDAIKDVDTMWRAIRSFLIASPDEESRRRDRGVLMRRLRHPEVGGEPQYGLRMVEEFNSRMAPRPRLKPPLCECGRDARQHDELTGECEDTGCEMFRAIP